jgi:hypothetical protein
MLKYCELIADRLLEVIVPRADAGACPCGDHYCSTEHCATTATEIVYFHNYTNCHCQITRQTCHGDCSRPR